MRGPHERMRDSWKLNTRLIPFRPHVAHGPLGLLPGSTLVVPCVPCWPWALFAHLAHLTAALAPCKAETVTIHHDTHPSHPAPILPISVSLHLTPHSSISPSFPSAASPPARQPGQRATVPHTLTLLFHHSGLFLSAPDAPHVRSQASRSILWAAYKRPIRPISHPLDRQQIQDKHAKKVLWGEI